MRFHLTAATAYPAGVIVPDFDLCFPSIVSGPRQTNDDQDRELMLRTLGQACAKTGWRVQGLGTDEQSLPLVNGDASTHLVEGMRWVQNIYTRRFNHRHKLLGHVFGGRYKAVLVEEEIKRTVARRKSWSSSLAEKSFIRNTALRAA